MVPGALVVLAVRLKEGDQWLPKVTLGPEDHRWALSPTSKVILR
jgi:hypothetical protein